MPARPDPYEPAPPAQPRILVRERDSNQSHLRMSYRPEVDIDDPKQRAALAIYSTLLGGSMGSRLFDEIREQRGLAYSVHSIAHAYADVPVLQLSAGLESGKCIEAYRRMRDIVSELRDDGPTEAEVERARAYAAGARAIAFENTGAVARHAAQQTIVYGQEVDPGSRHRAARQRQLRRGPRGGRRRGRPPVGGVRGPAHGGGARVRLRAWAVGARRRDGDRRVWRRGPSHQAELGGVGRHAGAKHRHDAVPGAGHGAPPGRVRPSWPACARRSRAGSTRRARTPERSCTT